MATPIRGGIMSLVSPSWRHRMGEILLLVGGVLVFLAFAEVALRLTGAADPKSTGYAPVDTRRRGMRPTNARGYRDLERGPTKPPGVRRILSLGDSFAWGASIEYDDTYAQRVERALNRRGDGRFEVIQLALPGMGTVDQASQLVEEGFGYEPDAVVLGFVLNDSEDENAAENRRAQDWVSEKQERKLRQGVLYRSALYRFLRGRLYATVENRRRVAAYRSQFAPDYPGWLACQKALHLMGGACRAKGVPFVVLIFPLFGNPLDASYPFAAIHAQVAQVAAESGAKVVDLLPSYRGLRSDILVVDGADDEHPNEIAHRIAANVLLRTLDEVLPPTGLPGKAP
jgi:hypothetical protein